MSIKELVEKLKTECNTEDFEINHSHADGLLLSFIASEKITEAYLSIRKYYV